MPFLLVPVSKRNFFNIFLSLNLYDISTNDEKPCSAIGGLLNLSLLISGGLFTKDELGNSLSRYIIY